MNERPTPETDAEVKDFDAPWLYYVNADFARKLERERDQAQKDLAEERHSWEKEREDWQADYAAVGSENKAMREAIKEAHKFAMDILRNYECGIEIDLKCEAVIAKLKPFLT